MARVEYQTANNRYLFYNHDYDHDQDNKKKKPWHMLIIPPLLNPKCFHTNFKLIVNILYFTKFKIKISEIRKRK